MKRETHTFDGSCRRMNIITATATLPRGHYFNSTELCQSSYNSIVVVVFLTVDPDEREAFLKLLRAFHW